LVGIKSREIYEAPAALALIAAHRDLEDLTLERAVAREKRAIDAKWAELVYEGLWFSPLREAFDVFAAHTQKTVSGDVRLRFTPGGCLPIGRRSAVALYDKGLATYDDGDQFDHSDAAGFIKLWGLPATQWAKVHGRG
jgi:argininosuccinate synthase